MVRRVLVTGGAGFIGSQVVDALVERGLEVVVLDSLRARPSAPADTLADGARLVIGDIRDVDLVERCLDGIDAVSHQASMVGLGVDLSDLGEYVSNNDTGTAALLTAMHRRRFRGRIVLASSMVVYGEGCHRCSLHGIVFPGPREEEDLRAGTFDPRCPECGRSLTPEPVTEHAPVDPRNVYAATKLHQEHLCAAYGREAGASFIALRYHNVYGSGMPRDTPYAGVASIFRSATEAGHAPEVFEDGCQRRDFVYVRDVALANVLALLAEPSVRGAFNISSGESRTVGELAHALVEASGPGSPRPVVTGRFRLGDVRHVMASPRRAMEVLGFSARVSFEDGMRQLASTPLSDGVTAGGLKRS